MRRTGSFLLAALAGLPVLAGPTLTTSPYDNAGQQITSAYVTVNGQARIDCVLVPGANGTQVTPTCDLSSLAKPGTYTLVVTVSSDAQVCTPDTSVPANWTCVPGGSASTNPFTLTWREASVSRPVVRLVP